MSSFGRLRAASHLHRNFLGDGWQFCSLAAGQATTPTELRQTSISWLDTTVPATAASSLRQLGHWNLNAEQRNFDSDDWWYRLRFSNAAPAANESVNLCFGGLATVADIWLNDTPILHSENMFRRYDCDVRALLKDDNELLIRFAALTPLLSHKRPRPRWKTPMVQHQQLRWLRTTLLGHTPGWSPPIAPVGPWRDIWLERQLDLHIAQPQVRATLNNDTGQLEFTCGLTPLKDSIKISRCELRLQNGEQHFSTLLQSDQDNRLHGHLSIATADKWWPHTHGRPTLYKMDLNIEIRDEHAVAQTITVDLGCTGFRNIELDTKNDNFAISVNGVPIFCRGACWTPADVVSLSSSTEQLCHDIALIRDAGMNMIRVGGTMVYESDEFLDLCDANGILLWQDFMFANMDYPETAEFNAEVAHEIGEQIMRLTGRPCLTVLCGNSEGEQQAAMFGATRDRWSPTLFHQTIPALLAKLRCDVPYWPSSAHGGAFPHQNNAGSTSYYGVGAYLRPLEDARHSGLRFASECLAFANVPEDTSLQQMPGGLTLKTHHPQWKLRTPRDLGAGWDFEDVRDHYLQLLFKTDPAQLRYSDHDRYLELSRIATGEVMAAAYREWRSEQSSCHGALIWFLRDLWHGAGWGILDADGAPKAAYHYLRRALQPVAASISDEGCNGLYVHLINDQSQPFNGRLDIAWYQHSETLVNKASLDVQLPPHSSRQLPVLQLLEYFTDLNHAYRFGPAVCDLVVAGLYDSDSILVSDTFHWPKDFPNTRQSQLGLKAQAALQTNGDVLLTVSTEKLAQAVCVSVDGCLPQDQYFHVAPGIEKLVRLTRVNASVRPKGYIKALNCTQVVTLDVTEQA